MSSKQKTEKPPETLTHKIIKWVFRLFLAVLLFLFLISISLVVIFNIPSFRSGFISTVLSVVNSSLEAKVEIDDIRFNGFSGLEISGFRLLAAGDTLAQAKTLTVDFELWDLLKNKALIYNLTLNQPSIKLLRNKSDSTWNFEHISKPKEKTPPSEAKWVLDIRKFRIDDGNFVLYDSTAKLPENKNLDFSFLDVRNLNMDLSANADLGANKFKVSIAMKLRENFSELNIGELSLKVTADTQKIIIPDLLLITDHSNIKIDFKADSVNIFKGVTDSLILNQAFNFHIKADSIDTKEVQKIGAFEALLIQKAAIDGTFHGSLSNLDIDDLKINTLLSHINFHGKILYPTEPEKLAYSVFFDKTRINSKDILELIPKESHATFPSFEYVVLENSYITGGVDTVYANLNASTGAGRLKGLIIGAGFSKDIRYKADLNVSDFNISKIIRDTSLTTNINGRLNVFGRGSNLKTMSADIRLNLTNSVIGKYSFSRLGAGIASVGTGKFIVDSLNGEIVKGFVTADSTENILSYGKFEASGYFDANNMNNPGYEISLKMNKVNAVALSGSSQAPGDITGNLKLTGTGFLPDSIKCNLAAEISECSFGDRMLFPFQFKLNIDKNDNGYRSLNIDSDFLQLSLLGNYNFSSLLKLVENQGKYLSYYISRRIAIVTGKLDSENIGSKPEIKIGNFIPVDFKLNAAIKDVSLINIFLDKSKLLCAANISLDLTVTENKSILKIDSISIRDFDFTNPDLTLAINPMSISGAIEMAVIDSVPSLTDFSLALEKSTEVYINDLVLKDMSVKLHLFNENITFGIASQVGEQFSFNTTGTMSYSDRSFNFSLDKADFTFMKELTWNSVIPLTGEINSNGINIKSCKFNRKDAETIELSGNVKDSLLENININVTDFPFKTINKRVPDIAEYTSHYDFNIKRLQCKVNGTFGNPEIDFELLSDNIRHRRDTLAYIGSKLKLKNSVLTGDIILLKDINNSPKKLLSCQVISLPLNLNKGKNKSFINSEILTSMQLDIKDLPLSFLSHFIKPVENLSGYANATFSVNGYAMDKLEYKGEVQLKKAFFTLRSTNMSYYTDGLIEIKKDSILLNNIILKNTREDLIYGSATIYGSISLKNFSPDEFDIAMQTNGLKVLNQDTYKAMPTLYGDFIIGTGASPIRFRGTLSQPTISGDINIIRADLTLPNTESANVSESIVEYQFVNNKYVITAIYPDTTHNSDNHNDVHNDNAENSEKGASRKNVNFADLLTFNLQIKILNSAMAKIDLGSKGQLYAEIASADPNSPFIFKQLPYGQPSIYGGEIVLKDNSSYKFFNKLFATTGKINFPTSKMDDPGLDLTAAYSGKSYQNDNIREFTVLLHITGNKSKPRITFDYTIDNKPAVGDSSTITQDAIFLLFLGRTKSDLFAGSSGQGNFMNETMTSTLSAYASKSLTEVFGGTGVIRSADIDLGNGTFEKARLNLTGQLFGNVSWRFGGTVADITNSNEISIDMPLHVILFPDVLSNVIIQLTKATYFATPTTRSQKNWEFKIKVGNSW